MKKISSKWLIILVLASVLLISGYLGNVGEVKSQTTATPQQVYARNYDLTENHPVFNICLRNVPASWGKVISTSINSNTGYAGGSYGDMTITFENGHVLHLNKLSDNAEIDDDITRSAISEINVNTNCSK